ncbi:hypothetical protein FRC03_007824 [Tulasnella sp. 419]|nr:hypothetical protein FRC03_007824 [Tulasnella sp. 419]
MSESKEPYHDVALSALNLVLQEISKVQMDSHHPCTELETLDNRIKNMHTALSSIDDIAKGQIANYHRQRNQLVSAILQLPNEIISEIFIHLIQSISPIHKSDY